MSIEEQLQAAKNEFGEKAFERFNLYTVLVGFVQDDFIPIIDNNHIEKILNCRPNFLELKPLPDLYAHDDSYYIDAFTMWQWRYADHSNDWTDCNKPLSFKADKEYRRKDSAALPFDLSRARAGDALEFFYYHKNEWVIASLLEFSEFKKPCVKFDYADYNCAVAGVNEADLRMKYPQRR